MKKKDEVLKQLSLELKKYIVPLKHSNAKTFTSNALVIEKSKPNNFIGTNDKIWNCSKGDNINILNYDNGKFFFFILYIEFWYRT